MPEETQEQTPAEHQASMTPNRVLGRLCAKRLIRVFNTDIETCSECGGAVKIIASIEDPSVIRKILTHLDDRAASECSSNAVLPEAPGH